MSEPRRPQHGLSEQSVEQIIGNLLRVGVLLAAGVVAIGGVIYLARHGSQPINYRGFRGEPDDLRNPVGVAKDAFAFSGRGVIALGLLLLVATPVARVIFSVFAFASERDWTYVVITLIVLAVLLYSLAFAQA
jgi:uncharacterized membrane protein